MTKIIVLASYRTGSTAFCDTLAKSHNIKNYDEHFHSRRLIKSIENYELVKNSSFVIKIMPDQIAEPYFSDLINSATHVYGIHRKDVIQQIASWIIAITRNIWHSRIENFDNIVEYEIPIDRKQIEQQTKKILKLNEYYDKVFKPLCHKEYVYEDIKSSLSTSSCLVLNKPKNYNLLINSINEIIKERKKDV